MKKALLVVMLCAFAAFGFTSADAATMYALDPADSTDLSYDEIRYTKSDGTVVNSSVIHKMAVELYSNLVGLSTRSSAADHAGTLWISTENGVLASDTLNMITADATVAKFNSGGTNAAYALIINDLSDAIKNVDVDYRFWTTDMGIAAFDCTATAGYVHNPTAVTNDFLVAYSSTIASPTQNLSFDVVDSLLYYSLTDGTSTLCNEGIPPATILQAIQVDASDISLPLPNADMLTLNAGAPITQLAEGPTFYVQPGLGDTCSLTDIIQIAFTSPRETSAIYDYAQFTKQFTSGLPSTTYDAELDTDQDFKKFVADAVNSVDEDTIGLTVTSKTLITLTNSSTDGFGYIAYANTLGSTTADFVISSAAPETGATISLNGSSTYCSATSTTDSTDWQCTGVPLGSGDIYTTLDINTANQYIPTSWAVGSFSVNVSTLARLCVTVSGTIGVWSGGLEVLVPFVKADSAEGYQTYIILYNRYSKDVPVYVSTFADTIGDSIMVGLNQITGKEYIPCDANNATCSTSSGPLAYADTVVGRLIITADDIQTFLTDNGWTWDAPDGIPVKFQLLVPQQKMANFSGTATITDSGDAVADSWSAVSGGENTAALAGSHQINAYDPYIEGYVVSTTPTTQRAVPLKFKQYKNGSYRQ